MLVALVATGLLRNTPATPIKWASRFEWHSRGQRFDPAYLHQQRDHEKPSKMGIRVVSLFLPA